MPKERTTITAVVTTMETIKRSYHGNGNGHGGDCVNDSDDDRGGDLVSGSGC